MLSGHLQEVKNNRESLPQHGVTVTCKRLWYTTTIIDGRAGGTIAPKTKIWEAEPLPPPHTHTHTHTLWCQKTPTDEFDIDEFYLCHRQLQSFSALR